MNRTRPAPCTVRAIRRSTDSVPSPRPPHTTSQALREHWDDGSRGWLLLKAVEAEALPVLTWMEGQLGAAAVAAAVRGASAGGGSASELLAAAVTADLLWVDGGCSSSGARGGGGGGGGGRGTGGCSSEVALLEWLKAHCGGLHGGGRSSSNGGGESSSSSCSNNTPDDTTSGAAEAAATALEEAAAAAVGRGDAAAMDAEAQFGIFVAAAAAGNGAALEWLAAEGCHMGVSGTSQRGYGGFGRGPRGAVWVRRVSCVRVHLG